MLSEPIQPIPELSFDRAEVALGRRLFQDRNLSATGQMSCATCHQLDRAGVDGLPQAVGNGGQLLSLNTPTVFNSGFNFRQNWAGSSATLEAQVDRVLMSPAEMDNDWASIIRYLNRDRTYRQQFQRIYGSAPTAAGVRSAIATFERSLTTPNAPFDRYLKGDQHALTATEKEGYDRFRSYGCVSCHQGVNVGGNMYQRLGTFEDYFSQRQEARQDNDTTDLGRMLLTDRPRDRHVFKVPSLRNVEHTAPYLHDGSVESLAEMVKLMGTYQLGQNIPSTDIDLIVQFLKTLSGERPNQP